VAASVWGNPNEPASASVIGSWDATRVWLERAGGILSGLPLFLDDTKRVKAPRMIADLLYAVANGRGRGRGNTKSIALTRTWQTVLLSTGESPATSVTQDGGTRMRCMEIRGMPVGKMDTETLRVVHELNRSVFQHYGHAGPAFVRWLMEHQDQWTTYRRKYEREKAKYANGASSEEAFRLAEYTGAIAVAATLVHRALKLPWDTFDPLPPALWADIVSEATGASGDVRALRDVLSWAYSHREAFYGSHQQDREGRPNPPPGGWVGRWDKSEAWTFIAFYEVVLRRVLHEQGYEPEAIFSVWRERGWLDADPHRYTSKKYAVTGDNPRLVVIRLYSATGPKEKYHALMPGRRIFIVNEEERLS